MPPSLELELHYTDEKRVPQVARSYIAAERALKQLDDRKQQIIIHLMEIAGSPKEPREEREMMEEQLARLEPELLKLTAWVHQGKMEYQTAVKSASAAVRAARVASDGAIQAIEEATSMELSLGPDLSPEGSAENTNQPVVHRERGERGGVAKRDAIQRSQGQHNSNPREQRRSRSPAKRANQPRDDRRGRTPERRGGSSYQPRNPVYGPGPRHGYNRSRSPAGRGGNGRRYSPARPAYGPGPRQPYGHQYGNRSPAGRGGNGRYSPTRDAGPVYGPGPRQPQLQPQPLSGNDLRYAIQARSEARTEAESGVFKESAATLFAVLCEHKMAALRMNLPTVNSGGVRL
jgi:hypothetical protein